MPRGGVLTSGGRDAITDVPGVAVGHCTLDQGSVQTGVTVVRVHGGSHFLHKVPAAATVFNGFGKSVGLMQVDELGVLDGLFEAAVEATEQAILNSLWFAQAVAGRDGHVRASLRAIWAGR